MTFETDETPTDPTEAPYSLEVTTTRLDTWWLIGGLLAVLFAMAKQKQNERGKHVRNK